MPEMETVLTSSAESVSFSAGIPLFRTTRCVCIEISDQPVNPKSLEKLEVIPASQSCPHVEIM